MTTAARVLELARDEPGRCERPLGSNRTPYAAVAGHPSPEVTSAVPPYPGTTRQGMPRSPVTRQYQQRLADRGWRVVVDGAHGPATTAVLEAFQTQKGRAADGIGGPVAWTALWTAPVT